MNYCSNCNELINANKCNICGSKKLREVQENDYCHFATLDNLQVGMFVPLLESNSIQVITMPQYYYPTTYSSAGRSPSKKLYVKFKDIAKATSIYKEHFKN